MAGKTGKRLNLINVRVDDQTRDELKELAKASNRTVSNYIATLIIEHLEAVRAGRDKPKK